MRRLRRLTRIKRSRKALARRLYIQQLVAMSLLGLIAGTILTVSLYNAGHRNVIPVGVGVKTVTVHKVQAVQSCDESALTYIRCRGQKLGYSDYQISHFIRIARCESGFNLNQNAKNPQSSATGIFQFTWATWDGNRCSGEKWNFKDNVDCFYKVYPIRGDQPWVSSKGCWNE